MVEQNSGGTVRSIAWCEVFPWLRIFRAFRIAITFRMLLLGAIGVFATESGVRLIGKLYCERTTESPAQPDAAVADAASSPSGAGFTAPSVTTPADSPQPGGGVPATAGSQDEYARRLQELARKNARFNEQFLFPIREAWSSLTSTMLYIFFARDLRTLSYVLLTGLWTLAVWALVGGAITRFAAVRLAAEERIGWAPMVQYAAAKWRSYFAAPLIPMLGILLVALVATFAGLVARVDLGAALVGILWPVVLICGFVMAVLLFGLLLGWPLMFATISVEGRDSFDALGRTYTYVFQRPLHYLFYIVVAVLLGVAGGVVVLFFAYGLQELAQWAVSWGARGQRMRELWGNYENLGVTARFAVDAIRMWRSLLWTLAMGFVFSYFWTAMTAIYFLLRRDADATELDEVYLDEQREGAARELPPLEVQQPGASGTAAAAPNEGE